MNKYMQVPYFVQMLAGPHRYLMRQIPVCTKSQTHKSSLLGQRLQTLIPVSNKFSHDSMLKRQDNYIIVSQRNLVFITITGLVQTYGLFLDEIYILKTIRWWIQIVLSINPQLPIESRYARSQSGGLNLRFSLILFHQLYDILWYLTHAAFCLFEYYNI